MNSFSQILAQVRRARLAVGSQDAAAPVRGFTLLELLIVIAIIVILSVMLIIVINPVETLRKSRDSQRISDLNTLKTAMGIYTTTVAAPSLGTCKTATSSWTGARVYYSFPSDSGAVTTNVTNATANQVTLANLSKVDGAGWIPVNFEAMSQGSPISAIPVDPVNTIASPGNPAATDLMYRYACLSTTMTYEVDARLESNEYTVVTNRMASDGGENNTRYEVGTNLHVFTAADGGF